MNASELANDMENGKFNDANYNRKKAADFVRQQQAEIEELKLKLNTWLFLNPASTITDKEIKDSVINCIGESEYERTDDHWWRLLAYDLLRKAQKK